jgi:hypothetical protein
MTNSYYSVRGVDTGVTSTANSADVRANLRLRLAADGEAGILVEEDDPCDIGPRFVAIYFMADNLGTLIRHLQTMQSEYQARSADRPLLHA